nr:ATP-binding cassette domain-containing protein [Acinetobacter sp. HY1485]
MSIQIKISNLHKHYANAHVLQNLNLSIGAGEFVAVVGKSGCGKSTLLRLIANLEQPNQGYIQDQQQNILKPSDIRVMFQDARLLPWKTAIDNIKLGLNTTHSAKALQFLEKVGLKEKVNLWSNQLSGGQKQRVALARALLHQPNVLLFDEPLGALDALTRLDMQQLIEHLWLEHQFTSVLVTHDVSEAVQLADRIILLDEGKIAKEFKVDLARPRVKNHAFFEIEKTVLNSILHA